MNSNWNYKKKKAFPVSYMKRFFSFQFGFENIKELH